MDSANNEHRLKNDQADEEIKELWWDLKREHLTRFYPKQKERFRNYAAGKLEEFGWRLRVDEDGNVIAGDVETAEVIYSAHYDTPMLSFYMTPMARIFGYYIGTILMSAFLIITLCLSVLTVAFTVRLAAVLGMDSETISRLRFIAAVVFFSEAGGLILLTMLPNPSNANDNTSGILGVMRIAYLAAQAGETRVAFVLFNNEEWGMKGSKAYSARYKNHSQFLCNFDCIGCGNRLHIAHKSAFAHTVAEFIKNAGLLSRTHIAKADKRNLPSDHLSFSTAINICVGARALFGGFYLPRIHMPYDNKIDLSLISKVADGTYSVLNEEVL